jgi:hypothetical protein
MVTHGARHDGRSFSGLLDAGNTASRLWTNTAYSTKRDLEVLQRRGVSRRILVRRSPPRPLPVPQVEGNAAPARTRSVIKHVFAAQKHRMALFVRTIGIARAQVETGMANPACNYRCSVWLGTRVAPA